MWDAYEKAQEAASGDRQDESARGEEGDSPEGGEEAPSREPKAAERAPSVESELDRIYAHIRNGTIDRLPPQLRGRAAAIQREIAEAARREYEEEQQATAALRQRFVELEALRQDDPEEFNRLMWETPESETYREFYEMMRREFPDLAPDSPVAAQRVDVERAKSEALTQVFSDMLTAVQQATKLEPEDFDAIRSQAAGPWEFLAEAVNRAVAKAIEKERAKIREEEGKAVRYEVQKDYLSGNVVVPRSLPQHVAQAGTSGPLSMREAFELARRNMNGR